MDFFVLPLIPLKQARYDALMKYLQLYVFSHGLCCNFRHHSSRFFHKETPKIFAQSNVQAKHGSRVGRCIKIGQKNSSSLIKNNHGKGPINKNNFEEREHYMSTASQIQVSSYLLKALKRIFSLIEFYGTFKNLSVILNLSLNWEIKGFTKRKWFYIIFVNRKVVIIFSLYRFMGNSF